MRACTIPILAAVALALAVPSEASARPRFGPAALLGAVAGSLGAVFGARPSFGRHRRSATRPSDDQRGKDDAREERRPAASAPPAATAEFWPTASADLVEYLLFPKGRDDRFWAYGYDAILNAVFTPPAADGARVWRNPQVAETDARSTPTPGAAAATDRCGKGTGAADADAVIERIEQALRASASPPQGLEPLRSALARAIERIDAACPVMPATFAGRLDAIQHRIGAMRDALLAIRLPFEKFYGSLTDEQRWRLNRDQPDAGDLAAKPAEGRGQICGEPAAASAGGAMQAIERAVRANEQQRAGMQPLRQGSAGMAQLIASSCPTYPLLGPMGRFAAATDRLDVMQFAVVTMGPALQQFYESLSDKQKAALERAMRRSRRSDGAGS